MVTHNRCSAVYGIRGACLTRVLPNGRKKAKKNLPSMHILRETNLSSTANLFESSAPVHGIGTDANGSTPLVSVDLNDTIEKLLGSAGTLLDPSLIVSDSEVLRTLHDGGLVIRHVLDDELTEEIRAGAEIGVEDSKVVAVGAGESPAEVTGLAKTRTIVANDVVEAVRFSQGTNGIGSAVVEDIDLELGGRPVELDDVLVGVLENLDRLRAAGEIDVDSRSSLVSDGELLNHLLVAIVVPILTDDADEVGDDEVDVEEADEDAVPGEDGGADGEEPHTRREG